ncbi:hypothetical protein T484DRAFT_1803128, partial [Baffinella frigidus]
MRGAGMGSKWALFAVLSLVQLAAAAGVGTCALPGDCVIKNHPTEKSWDNGVAFLTAVGCEKKLTVVFGSLANSTGAPTVTVESRIPSDPQTTADQTSLVTGMALAERLVTCCAQHPIDKEELDASAGDGGAVCGSDIIGELSNFDCMTIKQTNVAGGYAVMEVTFIAPYKADVSFDGKSEICLRAAHFYPALVDPVLTEQYCIDIQHYYPALVDPVLTEQYCIDIQ